eukprot:4131506-Pyramimonas_sp.AAC.1
MLLHVHARDSIIPQMLEELKSILRGDDRQFGTTVELLRNSLIVLTKSLKLGIIKSICKLIASV